MATETELERLLVRIVGDATEYRAMLKVAEKETQAAAAAIEANAKQIEGFGSKVKGYAAAAASALASLGAVGVLKEAFNNFAEAEQIGLKLTATLEANGRAVAETREEYESFAKSMEKVTTAEDDALLKTLALAESFNVTGAAATKAVQEAVAIAAVNDGAAESYVRLTAAVAQGNIELAMHMSRLVPQLRGAANESEFLAKFQQLVAVGTKAAAAETESASGQLKMLARDYGNALEEIGKFVAEGIQPVVRWLSESVQWFRDLDDSTKRQITTALAAAAAIGSVSAALKIMGVELGLASAGTLALKAGAAGLVLGLGYLIVDAIRATDTVRGLNDALKATAEQSQFTVNRLQNEGRAAVERIGAQPGNRDAIAKELLQAQAVVEIHRKGLAIAKEHFAEIDAATTGPITRALDPRLSTARDLVKAQQAEFDAAKQALREAQAKADAVTGPGFVSEKTKTEVRDLTKQLQEQVQTYGMTTEAARIFKLEMESGGRANLENARGLAAMKADLDALKKAKDEAAEATKKLNDEAANLANQLEAEIATFGMGAEAAKIFRLEMEGLDEARAGHLRGLAEQKQAMEEQKRVMEEGERLTKEILGKDPNRAFGNRMVELGEALDAGAIGFDVFNLGVKQAEEELAKAGKAADKAAKEVMKFDAAAAGGAEARQRVQQFLDMAKGEKGKAAKARAAVEVGAPGAKQAIEKQVNADAREQQANGARFDKMVDLLAVIAGKDPVILEGADFA